MIIWQNFKQSGSDLQARSDLGHRSSPVFIFSDSVCVSFAYTHKFLLSELCTKHRLDIYMTLILVWWH